MKENVNYVKLSKMKCAFLLECPMFSDIRMLYIKKYYWKPPSMIQFIELLKSENDNIVNNFAIFVRNKK